MKRLKSIFIVVLIFISGMIVGGFLGGAAAHLDVSKRILRDGPTGSRRVLMAYAKHELRLDEDQAHQFWQILNETAGELRDVADPLRPQLESTLQRAELRLHAVLKEHQRQPFEAFMERTRANWQTAWLGLSKPSEKPAPAPEPAK